MLPKSLFSIEILIIQSYAKYISRMSNITSITVMLLQNMVDTSGNITDKGLQYCEWIVNNDGGNVAPDLIEEYNRRIKWEEVKY